MMMIVKISRTNFFAFILVVHQNFVQKHPHCRIKSSARERDDVEIGERERLYALLLLKEHVNSRVKSDEMKWCNFDDFKGKKSSQTVRILLSTLPNNVARVPVRERQIGVLENNGPTKCAAEDASTRPVSRRRRLTRRHIEENGRKRHENRFSIRNRESVLLTAGPCERVTRGHQRRRRGRGRDGV